MTKAHCAWSRVHRYKAARKPACNGGDGCRRCWDKWHVVNARGGRDDRPRGADGAAPFRVDWERNDPDPLLRACHPSNDL